MAVTYEIVEHDGGWAYKVGQTFSETFPSKIEATRAARRAADEQQVAGTTEGIRYEDANGEWHDEISKGEDRPQAVVEDEP